MFRLNEVFTALTAGFVGIGLALSAVPAHAGSATTDKSLRMSIPGKPQAPVDIRYRFEDSLAVGQPATVTVYVTPLTENEALSARYRAKGTIGLRPGHGEWGTDELGRDSLIYTLQVTPNAEGRSVVQVIATIQVAGALQNRVLSIPVQTGAAGAKPVATYSGKVATTAAGQTVVSLPAATTIAPVAESE